MDMFGLIASLVVLAFAAGYLWSVAWTIGDMQRRGHGGGSAVLLTCFFGPFAALIWLIIRPRQALAERVPEDYSNPHDALAAAARLDSLGDWDAAIALYHSVARRWPKNATYCETSISEIERKRATGAVPGATKQDTIDRPAQW